MAGEGLQVVMVTAQKRTEKLQEVPIAATALDKRHIANYIDFGPSFGNLRASYFVQPRTFGVTLKTAF